MAVVLFALRYSLIDVVRLEMNGAQHRSNVDRTVEEAAHLSSVRPSLHLLKLQGFIFFGTAHSLLHRVRLRSMDPAQQRLRYLILDLRHVTGVDSSALLSLAKLQRLARREDFLVLCASVAPGLLHILKRDATISGGFAFFDDVDHAVEWCESHELESHQPKVRNETIEDILQGVMPSACTLTPRLLTYFAIYEAAAGETLAVQGDRTRDLFLVESGRVSAMLRSQHGEVIRLRTMGPGSVVGEIGLYLGRARTASIIAETESRVWRLSHEALAKMEENDPAVAAALHRFLAAMLAQRLIHANELLDISLR
jgi:SulP family sulfate permease